MMLVVEGWPKKQVGGELSKLVGGWPPEQVEMGGYPPNRCGMGV